MGPNRRAKSGDIRPAAAETPLSKEEASEGGYNHGEPQLLRRVQQEENGRIDRGIPVARYEETVARA